MNLKMNQNVMDYMFCTLFNDKTLTKQQHEDVLQLKAIIFNFFFLTLSTSEVYHFWNWYTCNKPFDPNDPFPTWAALPLDANQIKEIFSLYVKAWYNDCDQEEYEKIFNGEFEEEVVPTVTTEMAIS